MARQKTERMRKVIRDESLRLLGERVNDPTLHWIRARAKDDELFAGQLLKDARYFTDDGRITIAGMDYHRRETTRFRRARENWFPVTVVVVAVLAAMGGPFFDFLWGIVLP